LQSKQKAINTRDETKHEPLKPDQTILKKVVDEQINTTDEQLEKAVNDLTKVRNEILPVANDVADTIIRKYEKAKQRGQATELSSPIEPLTVTLNDAGKLRTQAFIKGLKLFDSNNPYWIISDKARELNPDRCGF
jgi:CHAD domain-containing protein